MRDYPVYTRTELWECIVSPEGYRVGWELHAHMNDVEWKWARLISNDGALHCCEWVRKATAEEIKFLSDQLKGGDLVCRVRRVKSGNAWAFATPD